MNYDELRRELTEEVGPEEAEALVRVAETLYDKRPVPRAAFRGDLRRRLVSSPAPRPAPARLRLLIAASGASGAALLLVAALSVAGTGPLAA